MTAASSPSRRSIRRHLLLGAARGRVPWLRAIAGWAGTAELAGAVIAPGVVVVEFQREEGAAPDRRHRRRASRA